MKRITQKEFIKRAKAIHGDKYNLSEAKYVNMYTKVCIICPKHGEWWVTPTNFLKGCGCRECMKQRFSLSLEDFVERATKCHNGKYDYSKVKYAGYENKVCIICPEHGEFWQTPDHHVHGHGCPVCSKNKKYTTEEFISECENRFKYDYDYSKVEYVNWNTKVCIICPKHGEFWITPNNFLRGKKCPKCSESKLEYRIRTLLEDNKIRYVYRCNKNNFEWLDLQHLDFYLPDYNIAIECQGVQHFYATDFAGRGKKWANDKLEQIKELDKMKAKKCNKNNIKLLYFGEDKYNSTILTEENEVLDILGL